MDGQRRTEAELRLKEVRAELSAIVETKVTTVDPTSLEDHLLDELDALEFELGIGHFHKHQ